MNWTRYGRIALFVNLALSLVFCYWAFALWYNRIDFEAEKKKWDEAVGGVAKTIAPAEASLGSARFVLDTVERRRPQLQDWYQKELTNLREGGPNAQIQAVVFDKGEIRVDANGQPVLGPILDVSNQEVKVQGSLKVLDGKYKNAADEIQKVLKESDDVVKETNTVTDRIGDGKEPAPGKAPGLRFQLASWQLAEKRSLNEQEFVKPLLYNRMADLKILEKRNASLGARLKEVEGAAVTQK
jgi:hypothetical protein